MSYDLPQAVLLDAALGNDLGSLHNVPTTRKSHHISETSNIGFFPKVHTGTRIFKVFLTIIIILILKKNVHVAPHNIIWVLR